MTKDQVLVGGHCLKNKRKIEWRRIVLRHADRLRRSPLASTRTGRTAREPPPFDLPLVFQECPLGDLQQAFAFGEVASLAPLEES